MHERLVVSAHQRSAAVFPAVMVCLCTQVFAQPIFETAEQWIQNRRYSLAERPVLMRIVVRCGYVALTCFVAILIPFFGDLMG